MSTTTGALAPLTVRDFRFLLAGFAIAQLLMPLQFITQILWVQFYAPPDIWLIMVAGIATCRGVGAFVFGLYGGALADRFDRRKLLLAIQSLQIITTISIGALMYFSVGTILGFTVFFTLIFLTSGLSSIDAPTRLAIIPDVLGADKAAAGISLTQVAGQVAMPVAMIFTGILIDEFDYAGAYAFSALGHLLAIVFIGVMHYQPMASVMARAGKRYGLTEAFADIRFGLAYARNHKIIFWVVMLMVLMMSLGYPAVASLGPTWVTTVVNVEVRRVGFMVMWWGVGSLLAAIVMAQLSHFARRGLLLSLGAVLFAVSFVIFVGDHTELNVIVGNIGLGAGMTTTMISSTILIQHFADNEVRGRVMSIMQLNMAFAQLMTMPVAILGQWLTLPVLFPVLSGITLLAVVVILLTQRELVGARIEPAY